MSFMRLPGEDPSTMLGGGQWANEYSYKNPTTGKWEYSSSPRIYGDNGDMTYEEWMKKAYGWEPGTYGAGASDYLYNQWLKSVTDTGKGRMNGIGEYIEGTKPNEAITAKASQLGESQATTANEESHSTAEDKGTDYSWITAATEEALPEQESEYPNGMSEDEFNDYYTFAYGMTHGTPWNLDDEGKRMPYYGSVEQPSSLAEQAKRKLDNYTGTNEERRKELQEEYDKYNNYAKTLSDFVEKYKDKYKGPDLETEIRKNQLESEDLKKLQDEYDASYNEIFEKQQEYSKLLMEKGIDWVDYDEVVDDSTVEYSVGDKVTVGKTPYTVEKADDNETIIKNRFGESYAVSKDGKTVSHKDGSYSGESKGFAKTYVNTEEGWKEYDKNLNKTSNISSSFAKTLPQTLDQVVSSVNVSNSSYPSDVVAAAKEVKDAELHQAELEDKLNSTRNEFRSAMASKAKDEQKEIMNAYASGKINAVQAANALARAQESGYIDFSVDTVMSDVSPDKFKVENDIGKVGDKAVGKDTFEADLTNPKISEPIITKFEHLNEIKEELGKVDITSITTEEEAQAANEKITSLTKNAVEVANRDFVTIYKELVNSGIEAKDLANNPKVKQLSQEAYTIGQDIYEKASELEAKTNELGLTNLDKKYIKKNMDEISDKVTQLGGQRTYSVMRNRVELTKDQVNALAKYADDIQSTKDAGLAIMKSAAFNGAENVTGGKYTEEWKKSAALETVKGFKTQTKDEWKNKLSWKDYFAAGAKGTLGTAVAILGGAVTAVNPILGIMLMTVGTASAGKAGLDISTKVVRSKSTNEEMMFGSGEVGKDVFRDIYNRSLEPANIGDAKSVGTYTSLGNGAISIVAGLVELLENPIIGIEAIRSGIEDINRAGNGGLSNNLDIAVRNIYELGTDISTFLNRNDLKPEALGLTTNSPYFVPNVKDKRIWNEDYTVYADDASSSGSAAASEYGSAESSEELSEEEKEALDTTYSGAKEQAKNSNLATDYNAGMEQDVNEAVSDKYVKVFKVMIDKEPDYIRKVLIAIPKMHSEREW